MTPGPPGHMVTRNSPLRPALSRPRAKEPPPNSHPKIIPNIFVDGFEVANGSLTKSFFSIGAWFPVLTWQRLKGMDGALLIDSLPLIDSDFYSVRMHHMMSI